MLVVPEERATCRDASEFVLPPGAVLAWTDTVRVLNVGPGRAQMTATITVVHPYWEQLREGHSTWEVRSQPVWLELHMPENAWGAPQRSLRGPDTSGWPAIRKR